MHPLQSAVVALTVIATAAGAYAGELPVQGPITSGVGWRPDPLGSGRLLYHRGIDIAVPAGTPVRATSAGVVTHAGIHGGHGLTVIVTHGDGSETLYGHNSKVLVARGEKVDTQTIIALSGNSGRSTGPHVHYEVRGKDAPAVALAKASAATDQGRVVTNQARQRAETQLAEIANGLRHSIYGFRPIAPAEIDESLEDDV